MGRQWDFKRERRSESPSVLNWCAFGTIQVRLLIRRRLVVDNAANVLCLNKNFILTGPDRRAILRSLCLQVRPPSQAAAPQGRPKIADVTKPPAAAGRLAPSKG